MQESVQTKVKDALIQRGFLKPDKLKTFCDQLVRSNAIIAGGFVLACFVDEIWDTDLDIFVPQRTSEALLVWINEHLDNFKRLSPYADMNDYPEYFLLTHGRIRIYQVCKFYDPEKMIRLDVIVCKEEQIYQVPERFDLTICQCWFDGNQVNCLRLEDVMSKTGSLTNSFWEDYKVNPKTAMNTRRRIKKYQNRGFIIDDSELSRQYESRLLSIVFDSLSILSS